MAIDTARAPVAYDEWRDRRWRLTGAAIGLLVVLTAALLVTTGMRPASYGDLLSDVAESKVVEVQVVGPDTPSNGDRVELRWSVLNGMLDQYAVVRIDDSRGYNAWSESVFVSADDPRETLLSINPNIQITSGSTVDDSSFSFREWRAPGAVVLLAGPLGCVAYLLLGGPLGVARPRNPSRRLTGGWAFLLAMIFFGGANTP